MRFILALALFVQANFIGVCTGYDDVTEDGCRVSVPQVETPNDTSLEYGKFIKTASEEQLRELMTCTDDGLALMSSWELIRRSISPLLFKRPDTNVIKINRRELSRFLGFVTGRLKVDIPTWWDDEFAKMDASKIGTLGMSLTGKEEHSPYHETSIGIHAPKTFKINVTTTKSILFSIGPDSMELPSWLLDRERAADEDSLTALFTDKYCYIALPRYWPISSDYTLWCVARENGQKVWSTTVRGPNSATFATSGGTRMPHYATIVLERERLYVFGGDMESMYIEAFSAKNGHPIFRFTTLY